MSDDRIIACIRVSDASELIEGSERRYCRKCGCAVWVSPSGLKAMQQEFIVACVICAARLITAAPGPVDIVPGGREELRVHALRKRRN